MEETIKHTVTISIEHSDGTATSSTNTSLADELQESDGEWFTISLLADCMVSSVMGAKGCLPVGREATRLVFLEAFLTACERDAGDPCSKEMYELHQHIQEKIQFFRKSAVRP